MIIHNFLRSSLAQAAAAAMDPGGLNGGAGLGGGIPESTRYPWMSITGRSLSWDTCHGLEIWVHQSIHITKLYISGMQYA